MGPWAIYLFFPKVGYSLCLTPTGYDFQTVSVGGPHGPMALETMKPQPHGPMGHLIFFPKVGYSLCLTRIVQLFCQR